MVESSRSVVLLLNDGSATFGWKADTLPRAFGEQLREAVRSASGCKNLADVELVSEQLEKVTPRDVFEGRVSRVKILPAGTIDAKTHPAVEGYDKQASTVAAAQRPSAVTRGSAVARGSPQPNASLLKPAGAVPKPVREFAKKGGSQMQFIKIMEGNKAAAAPPGIKLTREEVAKHNTVGDCWTIYQGMVYDITLYLEYHPGGKAELMKGAGTDCTVEYNAVHPWISIQGILNKVLLGKVVGGSGIQKPTNGALLAVPGPLAKAPAVGGQASCEFSVTRRRAETADIITLTLSPTDDLGRQCLNFEPGQWIRIVLPHEEGSPPVARRYTLTSRPGEAFLEISVKVLKGGIASGFLCSCPEGTKLQVSPPSGSFIPTERLRTGQGTACLLSAGVGITPLLSMAEALGKSGAIAYAAHVDRDEKAHAFRQRFVAAGVDLKTHYTLALGRPPKDFAVKIARVIGLDHDWYICGPGAFMTDAEQCLEEEGVDPARIHVESFHTRA